MEHLFVLKMLSRTKQATKVKKYVAICLIQEAAKHKRKSIHSLFQSAKPSAPTAYLASSLAYYANAHAQKLVTPCIVAVNMWSSQFSLQHGVAALVGIVLGKAECCW